MYPSVFAIGPAITAMILESALVLLVIALLIAVPSQSREDTARRIARERFARGEITPDELDLLLNAL
jgi:uncharacterized membrane protein